MTEKEPVDAFYGFQLNKRFYVVLCQDGLPSQMGIRLVNEIVKAMKQNKFDIWKRKLLESKIVFEDPIGHSWTNITYCIDRLRKL
jgi:hypothetical protein